MEIGTQIDIALGVLAFLAAQALLGAGWVLFRLMREPTESRKATETDDGRRGAFPRHA